LARETLFVAVLPVVLGSSAGFAWPAAAVAMVRARRDVTFLTLHRLMIRNIEWRKSGRCYPPQSIAEAIFKANAGNFTTRPGNRASSMKGPAEIRVSAQIYLLGSKNKKRRLCWPGSPPIQACSALICGQARHGVKGVALGPVYQGRSISCSAHTQQKDRHKCLS